MKVDFTGISDSFEAIPTGDYEAVFTGFKIAPSKSTPGEQVCVMEYTLGDAEFSGRKAWANRSLQPAALFSLKRDMIALGADAEELAGPIDLEESLEDIKGAECVLSLSVREYEGRQNNQIDAVKAA